MNSVKRVWLIVVLLTAVSLAACVRPAPRSENPETNPGDVTPAAPIDMPTVDAGEGGALPVTTVEPIDEGNDVGETTGGETGEETGEETGGETGGETGEETGEETGGETGGETGEETGEQTGEETNEGSETDEGTDSGEATSPPATPSEHVVKAGENLYRIGLLYNISWRNIAAANNIVPPYRIRVGQVLQIPGSGTTDPPGNGNGETTYVVKAGDTLYKIGQQFGISWVQIAEANGLTNPNIIKVGDTLKIPVNTPGPNPSFTHTVRSGETLYSISLQYGVSWTAIAAENNIQSPYVIFPGSVLTIPGNG